MAAALLAIVLCGLATTAYAQFHPDALNRNAPSLFSGQDAQDTLPASYEELLGHQVRPGFVCEGKIYGYYADPNNECKVFHVCVPVHDDNGQVIDTIKWSFICGNTTTFNQELLVCDYDDNVDCSQAVNFYHVNQHFGELGPGRHVPNPNQQHGVPRSQQHHGRGRK